jgi:hypothetical protein
MFRNQGGNNGMKKFALFAVLATAAQSVWAGGMACPYGFSGYGKCPYGFGGGLSVALYLVALALGYWVLRSVEQDKIEKKYLRRTGLAVGWVILLVGALGLACKATSAVCRRWCPDHTKKAAACSIPLTESPASPETTPAPPQQ